MDPIILSSHTDDPVNFNTLCLWRPCDQSRVGCPPLGPIIKREPPQVPDIAKPYNRYRKVTLKRLPGTAIVRFLKYTRTDWSISPAQATKIDNAPLFPSRKDVQIEAYIEDRSGSGIPVLNGMQYHQVNGLF